MRTSEVNNEISRPEYIRNSSNSSNPLIRWPSIMKIWESVYRS